MSVNVNRFLSIYNKNVNCYCKKFYNKLKSMSTHGVPKYSLETFKELFIYK